MCITVSYLIKIGQTFAELLHLTVFKITAIRHLGIFFKFEYFKDSC